MKILWIRRSIVRLALVGLVSLGIVGGMLGSSEPAAAMPREEQCQVYTDLSYFYEGQADMMANLGYHSIAYTYYNLTVHYIDAAKRVC